MVVFFLRLFALLPLPVSHTVGALLGWMSYLIPNRHRRIAQINIDLCFPQLDRRQRRRMVPRHLVEMGKALTELGAVWLWPGDKTLGLIRQVSGEEHLQAAIDSGRGILIIAPHLGNWELVGLYASSRYPMTQLYRPPRMAAVEGIMRYGRQRLGANTAPTDASGVRTLYQVLKRNEGVGMLPDQDPRGQGGVFAPFFGIAANTMTLLPRLASKSGAKGLFCFAERLPWARGFHLHILPAEGIDDPDPVAAAAAVNRGVEQCVRVCPEQYQWSYKRFRTRPEGEPPVY